MEQFCLLTNLFLLPIIICRNGFRIFFLIFWKILRKTPLLNFAETIIYFLRNVSCVAQLSMATSVAVRKKNCQGECFKNWVLFLSLGTKIQRTLSKSLPNFSKDNNLSDNVFSTISLHHKWNGTRLFLTESECTSCLTSCQTTYIFLYSLKMTERKPLALCFQGV